MYGSEKVKAFYQPFKSHLLGIKCVFSHQDLEMFGLKLNKYE